MNKNIDLESVKNSITKELEEKIKLSGVIYRIFSRVKSLDSIQKKLKVKKYENGKKMQDLIGIRITLYYIEDVNIIYNFFRSSNDYVNESISEESCNKFEPKILNLVMKIPEKNKNEITQELKKNNLVNSIDFTYEIQIRTVFSEGWHEIEHDMRYKCQNDWNNFTEQSRRLNGISASLENAEWAMQSLFENLAYKCYKEGLWNQMIRNKMRIHISNDSLSNEIINLFNKDKNIAKLIFKASRKDFITEILKNQIKVPLSYDHIVFILNRIHDKHSNDIKNLEKEYIKTELDKYIPLKKS